jgi:acyl dehydratase
LNSPDLARLIHVGENITRRLRYSRDDIEKFARLTLDENPLHRDAAWAHRAGFDDVIATGQQTSAIMMGFMATHFSRHDDGVRRELLSLNFNFAYKQPVKPERELLLRWSVGSVAWNSKLGGMLAHLDGNATQEGSSAPAVIGRGTILVKELP